MPQMTSQSACCTLTAASPALLFFLSLLLAHVHPSTSSSLSSLSSLSSPIQLQRRQSFFRCTGWGAGCSNLDYSFRQPAGYTRAEPRRYQQKARVVRPSSGTRTSSSAGSSANSRAFRHGYGLHFLFTSGTSWGANGKRSVDVIRPAYSDVKTFKLHNIIKEIQKRLSLQNNK